MKAGRPRSRSDKLYAKYRKWYLSKRKDILKHNKNKLTRKRKLEREERLRQKSRAMRLQQGKPIFEFRERTEAARKFVKGKKEESPCVDCRVFYPYYVMDYDHVRGQKVADISELVHKGKHIKHIGKEIIKCDVVNCHRERTHARQQELIQHQQQTLESQKF